MKWRHKKEIDKSVILPKKHATKKYSNAPSPYSPYYNLYYLLGLVALRYRNENRTGVIYYKYFGSIFVSWLRINYYGFKVLGTSDINIINVRLLTNVSIKNVIYSSSYKFSHYEVKT